MEMCPKQRTTNLVQQLAENEILLYDLAENKAFCLNDSSTIIWQLCDGKSSFEEIVEKTKFPEEYVWVAVEELQSKNLLEKRVETKLPADRVSRRKMLFKVGKTAVALPLIMAIIAPTSADAASGTVCIGVTQNNPPGFLLFCGSGPSLSCPGSGANRCCSGMGQVLTTGSSLACGFGTTSRCVCA